MRRKIVVHAYYYRRVDTEAIIIEKTMLFIFVKYVLLSQIKKIVWIKNMFCIIAGITVADLQNYF